MTRTPLEQELLGALEGLVECFSRALVEFGYEDWEMQDHPAIVAARAALAKAKATD